MTRQIILNIWCDFPAIPKERPRIAPITRKFYTPKRTREFETNVAMTALAVRNHHKIFKPTTEGVELGVYLLLHRPLRMDGDNCCKSIQDALNQIIYKDDRQVLHGSFSKIKISPKEKERFLIMIRYPISDKDIYAPFVKHEDLLREKKEC